MLILRDKTLFDEQGNELKTLSCPKKVGLDELALRADGDFDCSSCDRRILNTNLLNERQIVSALRSDPDQCIAVNLFHPDIEVVD